jgi:hypothetical protein
VAAIVLIVVDAALEEFVEDIALDVIFGVVVVVVVGRLGNTTMPPGPATEVVILPASI